MNIIPLRKRTLANVLLDVSDTLIRTQEQRHAWLKPASEQVRRWKEEDRRNGIEWSDK